MDPSPQSFDRAQARQVSRRNLPHWRQADTIYFLTFRLADGMPAQTLAAWRQERDAWLAAHPPPHSPQHQSTLRALWSERVDAWLDAGHGSCCLGLPAVQTVVEGALRHFDGERYRLGEYVVMPNHVHALVMPQAACPLSQLLHSWKSFTAHRINRLLGRSGPLWQDESFDHIVRSPEALEQLEQYIADNAARLPPAAARRGGGSLRQWLSA